MFIEMTDSESILLSDEIQRFSDLCMSKLMEEDDMKYDESLVSKNFKSEVKLFSYHLQSVIHYYIHDCFENFCEDLKIVWKVCKNGPFIKFRELSRDMILKQLGNAPSNAMYYTAFAQFAILRNMRKSYFEEIGWNQSWILRIIKYAFYESVLKENYDRVRIFGLSFAKVMFEDQGCSMGKFSNCYSTLSKWKRSRMPLFLQDQFAGNILSCNNFAKRFERENLFVGYTDSEIRSTMEMCCKAVAMECNHDNYMLRYITIALYMANYLIMLDINGLEYALDVISRWIDSSEIEQLESTYYDDEF